MANEFSNDEEDDLSSFISDDIGSDSSDASSGEWLPLDNMGEWLPLDNINDADEPIAEIIDGRRSLSFGFTRLSNLPQKLPAKALFFDLGNEAALNTMCNSAYSEIAGHLVFLRQNYRDDFNCVFLMDHPGFKFKRLQSTTYTEGFFHKKAIVVGNGDDTQNRLLMLDFVESEWLGDVPLYFENAIEMLRAAAKELCTSPSHDLPTLCYHLGDAHFMVSPQDKCFARLFPGGDDDVQPLPQWHGIDLAISVHKEVFIEFVSFFDDKSWFKAFGKQDQQQPEPTTATEYARGLLSDLKYRYRLHCDTHCDLAVVTRRSREKKFNYRGNLELLTEIVLKHRAWSGATAVLTAAVDFPLALYYFHGPQMTFDREAFIANCRETFTDMSPIFILPSRQYPRLKSIACLGEYKERFGKHLAEFCKNTRSLEEAGRPWYRIRQTLIDQVLALFPLELPSYVMLWILDWLPDYVHCEHHRKIHLIEKMVGSRRDVMKRRLQAAQVRDFKRQMWQPPSSSSATTTK